MRVCIECLADPLKDPNVVLSRLNDKGKPGVFACVNCFGPLVNDPQRIRTLIEQRGVYES